MSILDEIPALVADVAGDLVFYDAELVREVEGAPDPDRPWEPPEKTEARYRCKAIVEKYSDYYRKNELVGEKDRKVLVLAESLSTKPEPGDRIVVQNIGFVVINVATDPATAIWEIQGRM